MDLSPGTRALPLSDPDVPETSGFNFLRPPKRVLGHGTNTALDGPASSRQLPFDRAGRSWQLAARFAAHVPEVVTRVEASLGIEAPVPGMRRPLL